MGDIVTFYSYKGGAGRTMALANVAALLARWGYRTLMVDWDLDAPGLECYYRGYLDARTAARRRGIIDLLISASSAKPADWKSFVVEVAVPKAERRLWLLTAGKKDRGYFSRVSGFDANSFYAQKDGGLFVESLRDEWKETYDFVLVDSRTGITDIGGICTIQLPDILVLLFSANDTSLRGAVDVAGKAQLGRQRLPLDRHTLVRLPIPGRFDTTEEFGMSQEWLDRFAVALSDLYDNWLPSSVDRRRFLEATKVPYVPYFSFGEKLAVLEQGSADPAGLGYAYEALAALLAHRLEYAQELLGDRSKFVGSAIKTELRSRYPGPRRKEYEVPVVDLAHSEQLQLPETAFALTDYESITLTDDILPPAPDLFALRVKGNSMIDALVNDGDIVVLRRQHQADDGDMVAAWLVDEGETTLKRFYWEKDANRVRLQPANPQMQPLYVHPGNLEIKGKVVAVIRQIA